MDEINLKELFIFFVKKIKIIILITVLVLGCGLGYSFFLKKPLYSGEVTIILVSQSDGSSTANTQSDISLNQQLVATYTHIVKSKDVLRKVKEELELNYSVETLYSMISVSGIDNTEIIKINVNGSDPEETAEIANKLSEVFKVEVNKIYNIENVSIIDKAEPNYSPYNMHNFKDAVIYILVGLVLSCTVVFALYYFDNNINSSEQIENKFGIPVLGNVPTIKGGDK